MAICSIDACSNTTKCRGWCSTHYNKWYNHGDPMGIAPRTNDGPCAVEACTKDAHRKSYCYAHYMKDWRYGTPTPQHDPTWEDLSERRYGTLVAKARTSDGAWVCECDCGETATRRVGDLNRYGNACTCGTTGKHYQTDAPGYEAAHSRIKRLHGPASHHACITCGDDAYHWSYDHMDSDELTFEYEPGKLIAYSAKPEHYHARCVPCHKRYDLDRIDSAMAMHA